MQTRSRLMHGVWLEKTHIKQPRLCQHNLESLVVQHTAICFPNIVSVWCATVKKKIMHQSHTYKTSQRRSLTNSTHSTNVQQKRSLREAWQILLHYNKPLRARTLVSLKPSQKCLHISLICSQPHPRSVPSSPLLSIIPQLAPCWFSCPLLFTVSPQHAAHWGLASFASLALSLSLSHTEGFEK